MSETFRDISAWFNEVNWLISLLAAIPLSVLANLLTPSVQRWYAGRSQRAALARAAELKRRVDELRAIATDPGRLHLRGQQVTLRVLTYLLLGSAVGAVMPWAYEIAGPFSAFFFLQGFMVAFRHSRLVENVLRLNEVEAKLHTEISDLEKKASIAGVA